MGGFSNPVIGGANILIRSAIQSPNYVPGSAGWTVNKNGTAEFDQLILRGTFNGTNYIINSNGAFFYSGVPAAGNLVMSIASVPGTDAFGNAYLTGVVNYVPGQWTAISFNGASLNMYTATGFAGPYTLVAQIASSAGNGIFLTANGANIPGIFLNTSGFLIPNQPGNTTPETWHSLAPANGWTGTFKYRLTPENEVQISAALTAPASGVNSSTIVTLPAGYRPVTTHGFPAPASNLNGASTGDGRMSVTSAGVISSSGINGSAGVNIETRIPLDI